jgi:hypothetical protein
MTFKRIAIAAIGVLLAAGAAAPGAAQTERPWYKQPWDAARAQPCDRQCLVGFIDGYLEALVSKDRSKLQPAEQVFVTENTAHIDLGEGTLWRLPIAQTPFKIIAADPVTGQVAAQTVLNIQGRPALVAIRLKVERRMITEVEELYDRNVAPQAMELVQKPRDILVDDLPAAHRNSRDYLIYAANAYFDALTGEDGHIAPFADDCIRHEQGYQTVNNEKPGRAAPSPVLPDPSTPMGKIFSRLSTMTCEQQVSTHIFNGIHKIWPRRALIVDEQKGLVATFPLFIHDGTKRHVEPNDFANNEGVGMILNMVTMETFAVNDGKIHAVEAFPFVTFQYGLGDGWTPATGR